MNGLSDICSDDTNLLTDGVNIDGQIIGISDDIRQRIASVQPAVEVAIEALNILRHLIGFAICIDIIFSVYGEEIVAGHAFDGLQYDDGSGLLISADDNATEIASFEGNASQHFADGGRFASASIFDGYSAIVKIFATH